MYCPNCGYRVEIPEMETVTCAEKMGETTCPNCKKELQVSDRSFFEQEDMIEIVYR